MRERKKLRRWEDEKVGRALGHRDRAEGRRGKAERGKKEIGTMGRWEKSRSGGWGVWKVELGPAVVLKGRTMARQDAEGGTKRGGGDGETW